MLKKWTVIITAVCCFGAFANAETVYIKDELYVPLRSGPSSQHRILHKGIRSHTSLKVLGRSDEKDWVNVTTPSGLEGWIPSQYIVTEPTALLKLTTLEQQHKELTTKYADLSKRLGVASNSLSKTQKELKKTQTAQQKATMELHRIKSISSGAIELDEKYQQLLEEHELLQTTNDTLNAENESLKSDRRFSYMFYGAMLMMLGMLMTVILPHLKVKKRHSEWAN